MDGFKNMTKNEAARVAAAAGVRVTAEFTIEKVPCLCVSMRVLVCACPPGRIGAFK